MHKGDSEKLFSQLIGNIFKDNLTLILNLITKIKFKKKLQK